MALCVRRDGTAVLRAPMHATQQQIDRFLQENAAWLQDAVARRQAYLRLHPPLSPEEIAALHHQAEQVLPRRVAYYASRMHIQPAGVKITAAQSRFGSCSSRRQLCFSLYLMRYPDAAVDYVVVHELAHLIHMNHSKDFYAAVAEIMPDWKSRAALLKEPL